MSTYCSDMELHQHLDDTEPMFGFIDVAYCCFGRNVRLIVRNGTERIDSATAREIGRALIEAADTLDEIRASHAAETWGAS